MRRLLPWVGGFLLAVGAGVAAATPHPPGPLSQEVLVLTTPTLLPSVHGQRAISIQNLGPNAITCALGGNASDAGSPVYPDGGLIAVAGKAHVIAAYSAGSAPDVWTIDITENTQVWCVAATASQVTGGGTAVDLVVAGF